MPNYDTAPKQKYEKTPPTSAGNTEAALGCDAICSCDQPISVQTDRVDIKLRIDGVTSLLGELTGNSITQQDAA
jgi:hypothetical protein